MEGVDLKKFLFKIERPTYIGYISHYILKRSLDETQELIDKLVDEGLVGESEWVKKYYYYKNENESKT
jgi:hypothetical protein